MCDDDENGDAECSIQDYKITMSKTKAKMMKVNDIFVNDNNINKDCTVAYLKLVFAVV